MTSSHTVIITPEDSRYGKTYMHRDRQKKRHIGQTGMQTDRRKDSHKDRQTDGQKEDKQTYIRKTDRQTSER